MATLPASGGQGEGRGDAHSEEGEGLGERQGWGGWPKGHRVNGATSRNIHQGERMCLGPAARQTPLLSSPHPVPLGACLPPGTGAGLPESLITRAECTEGLGSAHLAVSAREQGANWLHF